MKKIEKNTKKFFTMLVACFIIVPCLAILFSCNDPVQNALTKQQYATAFSAVSTSLSTGNTNSSENAETQNLMLSIKTLKLSAPVGYVDATINDDMAVLLLKYLSQVMLNESYEVTDDTIRYSMEDLGPDVNIRQRVSFDGTNIVGFINMETGEIGTDTHTSQAYLFKINYNFNSNTLVNYQVDTVLNNQAQQGIDIYEYHSIHFDGENLYMLSLEDNNEVEQVKTQLLQNFKQEMNNTFETKNYNFFEELMKVQNGEV